MYENLKVFRKSREPFGIKFVGETVCDEKYYISRERSDVTSLEYVVEGSGTLEINGQTLYPQKGDIFFLTEGSRHKYYSEKDNPWHKYFVSFCGPVAEALVENYVPRETYLFKNCFLEREFSKIFEIAFDGDDEEKIHSKISSELFKIFNFIYDRRRAESEDLADKIKRSIDDHIADGFNLEKLCADMNYSKNHLINIFSQKFGITPYQYYKNSRIKLAREYLTNSQMTIGEISVALCFSDQQYFSQSFKKEIGCSPKKYREMMR